MLQLPTASRRSVLETTAQLTSFQRDLLNSATHSMILGHLIDFTVAEGADRSLFLCCIGFVCGQSHPNMFIPSIAPSFLNICLTPHSSPQHDLLPNDDCKFFVETAERSKMGRGTERMANLDKPTRQQLGQMQRDQGEDKSHKTGLHHAEETEQLIILHKKNPPHTLRNPHTHTLQQR